MNNKIQSRLNWHWLGMMTAALLLPGCMLAQGVPGSYDTTHLYFAPDGGNYTNYTWRSSVIAYTNSENLGWMKTNATTLRWEYYVGATLIATNSAATNTWLGVDGTSYFTSYWASVTSPPGTPPVISTNQVADAQTNSAVYVVPAVVFGGTNEPEGLYLAGRGSVYNQFDAPTGTNLLQQWVKTTAYGRTGWVTTSNVVSSLTASQQAILATAVTNGGNAAALVFQRTNYFSDQQNGNISDGNIGVFQLNDYLNFLSPFGTVLSLGDPDGYGWQIPAENLHGTEPLAIVNPNVVTNRDSRFLSLPSATVAAAKQLQDQNGNILMTADPLGRGSIYNPGTSNKVADLTATTTNWMGKFIGDGSALTGVVLLGKTNSLPSQTNTDTIYIRSPTGGYTQLHADLDGGLSIYSPSAPDIIIDGNTFSISGYGKDETFSVLSDTGYKAQLEMNSGGNAADIYTLSDGSITLDPFLDYRWVTNHGNFVVTGTNYGDASGLINLNGGAIKSNTVTFTALDSATQSKINSAITNWSSTVSLSSASNAVAGTFSGPVNGTAIGLADTNNLYAQQGGVWHLFTNAPALGGYYWTNTTLANAGFLIQKVGSYWQYHSTAGGITDGTNFSGSVQGYFASPSGATTGLARFATNKISLVTVSNVPALAAGVAVPTAGQVLYLAGSNNPDGSLAIYPDSADRHLTNGTVNASFSTLNTSNGWFNVGSNGVIYASFLTFDAATNTSHKIWFLDGEIHGNKYSDGTGTFPASASILTNGSPLNGANLTSGTVTPAALNGTGTPGPTTYYRGDGAWVTPSGGSSSTIQTHYLDGIYATATALSAGDHYFSITSLRETTTIGEYALKQPANFVGYVTNFIFSWSGSSVALASTNQITFTFVTNGVDATSLTCVVVGTDVTGQLFSTNSTGSFYVNNRTNTISLKATPLYNTGALRYNASFQVIQ